MVFEERGAALQAEGCDVVVIADVVGALVTADGPIKRDGWSRMAVLRRP